MVIVGAAPWPHDQPVKRTNFNIEYAEHLVENKQKTEAILNDRGGLEDKLFIITVSGMIISCMYSARYLGGRKEPSELWPFFEIEFEEPVDLETLFLKIETVTQFLSYCAGSRLRPIDVNISTINRLDYYKLIESGSYAEDYEVYLKWRKGEYNESFHGPHGSPFLGWDDEELAALRQSLERWVSRASDWTPSYGMLMMSLDLSRELSANRLLTACKCLEEIPIAQSTPAIEGDDLECIVKIAVERAEEMGYTSLKGRISSSLRNIRSESHRDRFKRLLTLLISKYGEDIVESTIVFDLLKAIGTYRGKAAHGHLEIKNEEEFESFSKATAAVEAFCFLLIGLDLPMSKRGLERARNNMLIYHYRQH